MERLGRAFRGWCCFFSPARWAEAVRGPWIEPQEPHFRIRGKEALLVSAFWFSISSHREDWPRTQLPSAVPCPCRWGREKNEKPQPESWNLEEPAQSS